jgi:hypothetical protein
MKRKNFLKALGITLIASPITKFNATHKSKRKDVTYFFKVHGGRNPNWTKQIERNLEGASLEKKRLVDKAIEVYTQNIKEQTWLVHPYKRLFTIYKKRKQYQEAIEVGTLYLHIWNLWNEDRLASDNEMYKRYSPGKSLLSYKQFFLDGIEELTDKKLYIG